MIKEFPVRNSSREEIVEYFCMLHNKVNIRNNKTIFDCKKAMDYWEGDCGCSSGEDDVNKKVEGKKIDNPAYLNVAANSP